MVTLRSFSRATRPAPAQLVHGWRLMRPAPATPSAEKSLEEIFEDGAEACLEPGGRCPHAAEPVILRALVGVGEHGVGLADFLEARLRGGIAGVLVRVELPCEVAVGLLELGVLGVAPDAEDGVVVLGRH